MASRTAGDLLQLGNCSADSLTPRPSDSRALVDCSSEQSDQCDFSLVECLFTPDFKQHRLQLQLSLMRPSAHCLPFQEQLLGSNRLKPSISIDQMALLLNASCAELGCNAHQQESYVFTKTTRNSSASCLRLSTAAFQNSSVTALARRPNSHKMRCVCELCHLLMCLLTG